MPGNSTHQNSLTEGTYLKQMRDLLLGVTSGLDCTIVLFGSRACGVHRRSSDIDVGFIGLTDSEFTNVRGVCWRNWMRV